MKRRAAAMVVTAGALSAVAMGSGLTAWANWSVNSATGKASVKAAALPPVSKPDVAIKARVPKVEWEAVELTSGHSVGGYVVTRHAGAVQTEACRVSAAVLTCSDMSAVPKSTVTYTVRAIAGKWWSGPPSPASGPLNVPGGPAAPDLAAGTSTSVGTGSEPAGKTGGKTRNAADENGTGSRTPEKVAEPGVSAPVPSASSSVGAPVSASPSPSVTSGEGEGAGKPE